jgi:hypothetical protein
MKGNQKSEREEEASIELKFILGTDLKIFELTCTNFRRDAFQLYKR